MLHEDEKHADNAAEEAYNPCDLGVLDDLEPASEVLDLLEDILVVIVLVALYLLADEARKREEAVGVGQHEQRDRRKEEGWGIEGEVCHGDESITLLPYE